MDNVKQDPREIIEDLVTFISCFESEYETTILPADEDLVLKYQRASERPLPPIYHAFLRRMGNGIGSLRLGFFDFTLKTVAKFRGYIDVPPEYLLIGVSTDPIDLSDLYLHTPTPSADSAVVLIDRVWELTQENIHEKNRSFVDYLFRCAFFVYCLAGKDLLQNLIFDIINHQLGLQIMEQLANKDGLEKVSYLSPQTPSYWSPTAAIRLDVFGGEDPFFCIYLRSNDRKELLHYTEYFKDTLGNPPLGWRYGLNVGP